MNKLLKLLTLIVLLTNCGFKVVNNNELRNFNIVEIETSGESRVNFSLKNDLKNKKINNNRKIKLNLETDKIKEIKENNIKNEITKYSITITTKVNFELISENKLGEFTVSRKGNYNVQEQYSQTLNNEKNLIDSLTDEIVEEIFNNLAQTVNDL
tara:strand:+ start:2506 stop:2970 length:465 start_codon:yes stop_codon:yes gene_type:complete